MSEGRTRVAVLSPYPIVVEGLTAMLGRHSHRVEVVDVVPTADQEEPDVVLYDVAGLAESDDEVLDHLVKKSACVVLAVGRDLRPDLLGQALALSVDGFFSMNVTEAELLAAVDSATTGWQTGDAGPDPVVGSSDSEQRAHRLGVDAALSDREAEVLSLIARGLTNDEIARKCFLSINSVKTYIRTSYRKIGVRSRSQAVAWAVQHGFATHHDQA
jgi:DNA-binding NarL/FixJ family response regulator